MATRAKELCLSALGSAVAGAGMDLCKILIEYARAAAAAPEAGVIGTGLRTSTELAALLNCTASHCTELEDVSFPELGYTCGVIPAMFTLGEKCGSSGRAVLEAVIVGFEITARPAMFSGAFDQGWQPAPHFGTIGVAAGAAKLLELDATRTGHALSIGASFAAGLARQAGSGAHTIEAGNSGRNGIMAALLAARGVTGNPTIMEGPCGYWDTLAKDASLDFSLGTGEDFRVMEVGVKVYPCCYFLQCIIEGALAMVREHGIVADEVERVEVLVNALYRRALRHDQPCDGEEARFSIPHSIAAVLAGEDMFIETFSTARVHDARLVALRDKVKVLPHADWNGVSMASDNSIIVRMKDGRSFTRSCVAHRGNPRDPLTQGEMVARFEKCVVPILSRARSATLAQVILALEVERNVAALPALFTPSA